MRPTRVVCIAVSGEVCNKKTLSSHACSSEVMLTELPALCVDRIVELLATQGMFRRQCDVVLDCARLAATSRYVQINFAVPLGEVLSPPTSYETLPRGALVPQLKALCRESRLAVGGNKAALRERLRVALQDVRQPHCRLGPIFCERARQAFLQDPSHQVHKLLRTLGMNLQLMQSPFTFASVAEAVLAPFFGDEALLLAACLRVETIRLSGISRRHIALEEALAARGCVLRNDSETSSAYIHNTAIQGLPVTLERAVDVAEEMQFLYTKTSYRTILSNLRHFDRDRSSSYWRKKERYQDGLEEEDECLDWTSMDSEDEEEGRRRSAKRDAVKRWTAANKSDLTALPRSLCVLVEVPV